MASSGIDTRSASLLAILLAALVGFMGYTGSVISDLGIPGVTQRSDSLKAMGDTLVLLQARIDSAKAELATGSIDDVRRKLDDYKGSLRLLRRLVPEKNEVPDLLDEVSTRAKRRGVAISAVQPSPVESGPAPFDTYKYSMSVMGPYDAVGQFLADIASLNRVVVPYDVSLQPVSADQVRMLGAEGTYVQAKFNIRTYVKAPNSEVDGSGI